MMSRYPHVRRGKAFSVSKLTLAGSTTGIVGINASFTVTLDVASAYNVVVTPTAVGATVTPSSFTILAGSLSGSFSVLMASAGSTSVSVANSLGLTQVGGPITFAASSASAASPPTAGSPQFTLTSSTTQTAPFSLGFAFRKSSVPTGSGVSVSGATAQVVPKNTWPDGSLKFATVSGTASLTANTPLTVSLAAGTSLTGTALTTGNLKTALTTPVTIDAAAFGSASWSGTDWDTPFQSWDSGPQMSSWVYRKTIGADPHLVGWLEVRLFASGAVEVLPWIENGYLMVVGPTNKNATYTFTLGGTVRFTAAIDLPHHCRTPLVSGTLLSHWLGTDPALVIKHNVAYLQSTELVPTYSATVPPTATAVTSLPPSYAPLQQGGYSLAMGQTGYQAAIGLLPEWDALYLTTTADVVPGLVRNAYSAGRYPIHYRDETTNRPLRFSSWPNLSINSSSTSQYPPTPTGTAPPAWDVPHHPSVGFMAYLVTGRWYFMEELQFAATVNYLSQVDIYRSYSAGVFLSSSGASTTRGAAWANRTIAQCASMTPDGDTTLAVEFRSSLASNITWNYTEYVAAPNNPYGCVQTYGDVYGTSTDGKVTEAPWQQDFYTAAYGYMLAMNPPVSTTVKSQLSAFFSWKAQFSIGRLGGTNATDWLYADATPYNIVVAFVDFPNWNSTTQPTGPWPASWGAMYAATYGYANPGVDPGLLRGGYYPDATGYWGNFMPGIAYAVRHGVPGALAAYTRMSSSSNWSGFWTSANGAPEWAVVPASGLAAPLPAWMPALSQWQWYEILGTSMNGVNPTVTPAGNTGPSSRINTWNPIAADRAANVLYAAANGGHSDYSGNEVVALNLAVASPTWVMLTQPTPNASVSSDVGFYADGRPSPTHGYWSSHYVSQIGRIVKLGAEVVYGTGTSINVTSAFNVSINDWDGAGTSPNIAWPPPNENYTYSGQAQDHTTGDIYYSGTSTGQVSVFSTSSKTITPLFTIAGANSDFGYYHPKVFDTSRGTLWLLGDTYLTSTQGRMWVKGTNTLSVVNFSGNSSSAFSGNNAMGAEYEPVIDKIVAKGNTGATVYVLDPVTAAINAQTTTGGVPPDAVTGVFGKFKYLPNLGGFVYYPSYVGNVWFLKTNP